MSTITVPVNDRADISFEGERLATVSTQQPGRGRWTELTLYCRDDGGYVFQRVGRSDVYHRVTCRKVFGRLDMEPADADTVEDEDFPCDECRPGSGDPDETVIFERDKNSAVSVDNARRLLSAMQDRDRRTNELRISQLAQELLIIAAESDVNIRNASRDALLSQL